MGALCSTLYSSPLGCITLASEGSGLVGLWFEGQKHFGAGYDLAHAASSPAPPLRAASAWLDAYFAGERPAPSALPLAPRGSPFRLAVWSLLLHIPYGQSTTYGALAHALIAQGLSASARAVGNAVAHNPISIIIPCHRVLSSSPASRLHYAAGSLAKQFLLNHEA